MSTQNEQQEVSVYCFVQLIIKVKMFQNIVPFSFVLLLVATAHCQNDNTENSQVLVLDQKISQAQNLADRQTRLTYWYYLRKSEILFSSQLASPNKIMIIRIYRSIVGTFLSVCSIDATKKLVNIDNFIRLGNGASNNNGVSTDPIVLHPLFIEHKLAPQEYPVILSEEGSFILKGITLETTADKSDLKSTQEQIQFVDAYLRRRYWLYIRGAELIDPQAVKTNLRTYVLLTYVNKDGSYLVISSIQGLNKISVNTFVRLGKPAQSTKIEEGQLKTSTLLQFLEPAILILN